MAELTHLKKKRGANRRAANDKIQSSDKIIAEYSANNECDLSSIKMFLLEKIEVIRELDEQILDLSLDMEDNVVNDEVATASDMQVSLRKAIFRIDECLARDGDGIRASGQSISRGNSVAGGRSGAGSSSSTGDLGRVKLPKLELPKFSGDVQKYQAWRDSYDSLIHKNDSLNEVDKFNYLRSVLGGAALSAISGIAITKENYNMVIEILGDRFGQRHVVIASHMDALMKIPTVANNDDIRKLRRVYDQIESHIRSLEVLEVKSENYGCLLVPVVLNRLPDEMRLILSRKFEPRDGVWELNKVLEGLKSEIEARERVGLVAAGGRSSNDVSDEGRPTAAVLYTGASDSGCVFCKGNHTAANCRIVTEPNARRAHLRRQGRCFICLKSGHLAKHCKASAGTRACSCEFRHHVSLCERKNKYVKSNNANDKIDSERSVQTKIVERPVVSRTMFVNSKTSILLQTARAKVRQPGGRGERRNVRIILDTGSQKSYIRDPLCEELHLRSIGTEYLQINTFGESEARPKKCKIVQLELEGHGDRSVVITACVVPLICPPPGSLEVPFLKNRYPHLRSLELADYSEPGEHLGATDAIEILIGSDYYWAVVENKVIKGKDGPTAVKSLFGWVLSGPIHSNEQNRKPIDSLNLLINSYDDSLTFSMNRLWDLEAVGLTLGEDSYHVLSKFNESVRFKGPRYEVQLPWKNNHTIIGDNYHQSLTRLQSLLGRLKREPNVALEYEGIIKEQLETGVLEHVNDLVVPLPGCAYYMPHHAVVRREKVTTKVRIVCDASSKTIGPSLNEALHQGPCLLPELVKVLLRFRLFKVGITADIEKAFLQVEVAERDRDFLRILWVRELNAEVHEYQTLRFTRCVFGVTSSPFHLMATLNNHFAKYKELYPQVAQELGNCMYVDDLTSGADTDAEGLVLARTAKTILAEGGFNLRKFVTNSEGLNSLIVSSAELGSNTAADSNDLTYSEITCPLSSTCNELLEHKVLGVVWDTGGDNFVFKFEPVLACTEIAFSKRGLLQIIARCFDPLGLVSPVVMSLKFVFQEVCKLSSSWDSPLLETHAVRLRQWVKEVETVRKISLCRCVLPAARSRLDSVDLVAFCDASKTGYGAVIYVRSTWGPSTSVRMLISKGRLAPIKEQSIPRLELLACVLLARLIDMTREVLKTVVVIQREFYFSDSRTALCWIKHSNQHFKQFVENRALEIRRKAPDISWYHVAGKENPADLITRGCSTFDLSTSSLWKDGPSWLKLPLSEWPTDECHHEITREASDEMKVCDRKLQECASLLSLKLERVQDCIDPKVFSSAGKLFRVTSWVLRFSNNLLKRIRKSGIPQTGELLVGEVELAEEKWILWLQREGRLESSNSGLEFFVDERGIMRCKGRLSNADLSYEQKFPVFIPRHNYVTELIVRDMHLRLLHSGSNDTMALVRSKYWIPRLRQLVRKLIHSCVTCRRIQGKCYQAEPFPPLPESRVTIAEPFSSTGVDFAGPLYVRSELSPSDTNKVYILLLTCASTRAVHLELTRDLTSASFLLALRRFIARRGTPRVIFSDNAKTFKSSETSQFLRDRGIVWNFNLAEAPWAGGVFERMIGVVKKCLRKVLGRACLGYQELETVLVEVEGVVNDRPLTYIDTDTTLEALTPNHLIIGRRLLALNDGPPEAAYTGISEVDSCDLRKRVLYKQKLLLHFWRRWKAEYLLALRCAKGPKSRARDRVIREGDVVIVEDQGPRLFWRLGKIESLIVSKDGLVRGAQVKVCTKSGERGGCVLLERPLQRLYPLEFHPIRVETGLGSGHADTMSPLPQSLDGEAQTGHDIDKRPSSQNQQFSDIDEAIRIARSRVETHDRKSKRAAARDCDFLRNYLQHR